MRVVSADRKKFLAEPVIVNTPKDFGEGIETLKNIISNLSQGAPIEAIVGGVQRMVAHNQLRRFALEMHRLGQRGGAARYRD